MSAVVGQVQPVTSYLSACPGHEYDKNLRTTRFLKVRADVPSAGAPKAQPACAQHLHVGVHPRPSDTHAHETLPPLSHAAPAATSTHRSGRVVRPWLLPPPHPPPPPHATCRAAPNSRGRCCNSRLLRQRDGAHAPHRSRGGAPCRTALPHPPTYSVEQRERECSGRFLLRSRQPGARVRRAIRVGASHRASSGTSTILNVASVCSLWCCRPALSLNKTGRPGACRQRPAATAKKKTVHRALPVVAAAARWLVRRAPRV